MLNIISSAFRCNKVTKVPYTCMYNTPTNTTKSVIAFVIKTENILGNSPTRNNCTHIIFYFFCLWFRSSSIFFSKQLWSGATTGSSHKAIFSSLTYWVDKPVMEANKRIHIVNGKRLERRAARKKKQNNCIAFAHVCVCTYLVTENVHRELAVATKPV